MITREQYIAESNRYHAAHHAVIAKYQRREPLHDPLTEQAAIYEAFSLVDEDTRIDRERLLSVYALDMSQKQMELTP